MTSPPPNLMPTEFILVGALLLLLAIGMTVLIIWAFSGPDDESKKNRKK